MPKVARLAAMDRRRRKYFDAPARTGLQLMSEQDAIRNATKEMHRGGVTIDRAPQAAVDLVIDAKRPPDSAALRGEGEGEER